MRLAKVTLGAIVLVVAIIILYFHPFKNNSSAPSTIKTSEIFPDGKYCFGRSQKATPSAPYSVEEHAILYFQGGEVTGTKTGTQAGPDMTNGYAGSLEGTREGNNLTLIFSYSIEGSENKEKELYTLSDKKLEKNRYQLVEKGGMLVPDLNTTPQKIIYGEEPCTE